MRRVGVRPSQVAAENSPASCTVPSPLGIRSSVQHPTRRRAGCPLSALVLEVTVRPQMPERTQDAGCIPLFLVRCAFDVRVQACRRGGDSRPSCWRCVQRAGAGAGCVLGARLL
eukprot:7383848-Prymnesium_polylepis.2